MAIAQHGISLARFIHLPRTQPALPVQRIEVARHVRAHADLSSAEREPPTSDAIDERDEREAARLQHIGCISRVAQDRNGGSIIDTLECDNAAAQLGPDLEVELACAQREPMSGHWTPELRSC